MKKSVIRQTDDSRQFPINTCPASRHAYQIGCALMRGEEYPMLQEEPQYCGESIMATVGALFRARTQVNAAIELLDGLHANDLKAATGARQSRCQELLDILRGNH